ncbi:MAG: hypothetical protein IEMM0002_0288 [bacterium]|nr:MAG: hypothetical protein IEMM0002_0288 [bacterium]
MKSMKKIANSMKIFMLAAYLPVFMAACGDSSSGDNTPPVTTASPAGGPFSTPQTITLSCSDDSGCEETYYSYSTDPGLWRTQSSNPLIAASGTVTLEFFSIDKANNVEDVKSETYVF